MKADGGTRRDRERAEGARAALQTFVTVWRNVEFVDKPDSMLAPLTDDEKNLVVWGLDMLHKQARNEGFEANGEQVHPSTIKKLARKFHN